MPVACVPVTPDGVVPVVILVLPDMWDRRASIPMERLVVGMEA